MRISKINNVNNFDCNRYFLNIDKSFNMNHMYGLVDTLLNKMRNNITNVDNYFLEYNAYKVHFRYYDYGTLPIYDTMDFNYELPYQPLYHMRYSMHHNKLIDMNEIKLDTNGNITFINNIVFQSLINRTEIKILYKNYDFYFVNGEMVSIVNNKNYELRFNSCNRNQYYGQDITTFLICYLIYNGKAITIVENNEVDYINFDFSNENFYKNNGDALLFKNYLTINTID